MNLIQSQAIPDKVALHTTYPPHPTEESSALLVELDAVHGVLKEQVAVVREDCAVRVVELVRLSRQLYHLNAMDHLDSATQPREDLETILHS